MDLVDQLRAFVATAQTGSFTGAAAQMSISNRLTSKYVAELEARLGVRLFQRTTRKVGLTPAGEDLLSRAPALLDELDDLLSDVSESSRGFSGVIRVAAPLTFGEIYVGAMLGRFAEQNPDLTLDLRLSDEHVDLAAAGIDLAFRFGRIDTLSLKARRLGAFRTVIAAHPTYLSAHGWPRHPDDLRQHRCIIDSNRKGARQWETTQNGKVVSVTVEGPIQVNSARAAVALAEAGMGIVYAPRFACADALAEGRLLPLLPEYDPVGGPVNAVYLEGRALPRKVRALLEFAVHDIAAADIL